MEQIASDGVDYIFHCAAVTKSSDMVSNPTEVIEASVYGTANALNLAREKSVRSMVYTSSMEVYGATDPSLESIAEEHLGYVDLILFKCVFEFSHADIPPVFHTV